MNDRLSNIHLVYSELLLWVNRSHVLLINNIFGSQTFRLITNNVEHVGVPSERTVAALVYKLLL